MRLFLIRHGQTEWNAGGRAQGHSDVELDELGLKQAEAAAAALNRCSIKKIISSDLRRCIQTAEPLSRQLEINVEPREDLRERTFGTLEGAHYTEIRAFFTAEARVQEIPEHDIRPDDGESIRDVWNRLQKLQRQLDRAENDTVVFGHGGTTGVLLARLMHGNVATARSFRFENASITELIRRPDGFWQLLRFADTSHLATLRENSSKHS